MAAKEDKEKEDTREAGDRDQAISKKTILIAFVAFLLISILSSVFFYILLSKEPPTPKKNIPTVPEVIEIEDPDGVLSGAVFSLQPFLINLRDNSGILQLEISIEFYDFVIPKDLDSRLPALRNHVITKVSNLSASELKAGGMEELKFQIKDGINDFTPEYNPVEKIYIESFFIR